MVQLENLRLAANVATAAVNARGPLLINRLHDIPARAHEIAIHGIRRGAAVALAATQVQTGHDLYNTPGVCRQLSNGLSSNMTC